MQALISKLLAKRNEAVQYRASSGVEARWLEDEEAYDGLDATSRRSMLAYATGTAEPSRGNEPRRSKVIVNIIRGKCEQTEGRFADIQLPTDDRNWGLKVTPVPELSLQLDDETPVVQDGQPVMVDGKQVTLADLAKNEMAEAEKKMAGMEKEIDDQLNECSFNAECRKALASAVRLGTGILKGPGVLKQIRKVWKQDKTAGAYVLDAMEEHNPYSKSVAPWNVYPDPECGEEISRASYIFERDFILPRELKRLAGVPGYNVDEIKKILAEEPVRTSLVPVKGGGYDVTRNLIGRGQSLEMWEYHGDLTAEELLTLNCDCGADVTGVVAVCVVIVNDRPIKAMLNTLDTGDLPYDFFQWSKVTDSVWGIGLPRIQIWQQRIITAAWRAMMDNAGDSAGVNIVIGTGVEPDDGVMEITGKKIWRAGGDMIDVRQAFAQFQVGSNQQDLQRIIEMALRFTDLETALPMAFAGEQVGPAETLGATELKIDSSNVALRSRVKLWDDNITRPHLTRYYHWNMQYNDNDDIKGDYNVDPRGVSVLLQKEKSAQSIIQLLPFRGDPLIGSIVDWEKALKQLFKAQNIDILKTDEEIEAAKKAAQEQPPQDPRVAASMEVAKMRTDGDIAREQMQQQTDQAHLQANREEAQLKREHDIQLAMLKREEKMLELAAKGNMSLEQIKAELAKESMKLNVQRELSVRPPVSPKAAVPPTEPNGKAQTGRAFEQ